MATRNTFAELRWRAASLAVGLSCMAVAQGISANGRPASDLPPPARKGAASDTFHGVTVADPYRWLETLDSSETRAWLAAQGRYARAQLAEDATRSKLRQRLAQLGDAWPDAEVPFAFGARRIFQGMDATGSHAALFVRDANDGEARLLVDPATLGDDATLTAFEPSPDGEHVAVVLGNGGSDWGEIRTFETDSGKLLPEVLRGIRFGGSVQWTADAAGFMYRHNAEPEGQVQDAAATGAAIHLHRLRTPQSADALVYSLPAADTVDKSLAIGMSDDRRQLFVNVERGPWLDFLGGSQRQVSVLDIGAGGGLRKGSAPIPLTQRPAAYRVVATRGTRVYMLTDLDAPRRRLVSFDRRSPGPETWKTIIAETDGVLESVHHVGNRFVAVYMENVHSVLRVFDMTGKPLGPIALPDLGTVRDVRADPGAQAIRFVFESFLTPPIIVRHDLASGNTAIEVRGKASVDASRFETRQLWFASRDGTRVPIFVVHRRGLERDGTHRTILYGYGASGDSSLPAFSEDIFAWLEMGGVYAVANVRGGGEFGRSWYEAAIRERKQTSFDDFIAAAEFLIAEGFTSAPRLAIRGASNGGLLVTAAMTQRPDLFAVVLADVPVTDALRRSRSGTGAVQTAQWGTTEDESQFKAMLAYSPLHNVAPDRCYPATLITTSRNDDRLPPWHAYKFTATLQAAQTCDRPIVLHVRDSGAHGGASDVDEMFDGMVRTLSFAFRHLEKGTEVVKTP